MGAPRGILGIFAVSALCLSAVLAPAAHGASAHHAPTPSALQPAGLLGPVGGILNPGPSPTPSPTHSASITTTLKEVDNIKWGSDPTEVLDMYRPKNASILPQVIMVHGGAWSGGTRSQITGESKTVAGWGYVVYNVDYRVDSATVPGNPLEPNEIKAVGNWVINHSTTYGGLKTKLAFIGGSSSAQVVLLAAEQIDKSKPKAVLSVISLSSLMNFQEVMAPIVAGTSNASADQIQSLQDMLGCHNSVYACTQQEEIAASPTNGIDRATCPAFMIVNGSDEEVPMSQPNEMVTDLRLAGCKTVQTTPTTNLHGFKYWSLITTGVKNFLASTI